MAVDFLGRELPEQPPTAQTVEEFAREEGNLPDDGEDQTTEKDPTTE
jgi:hypothetical protein